MRNTPYRAINAIDGTTNPKSIWMTADQWFAFSATVLTTGTMAGTLKVQISNDPPSTTQANIVGSDLVGATIAAVAGTKSNIPFVQSSYQWARLVFTTSGGAGTVTSDLNASGF